MTNYVEGLQLVKHMLRELESPRRELTAWELGFLESVAELNADGRSLSDRQLEVLERIYSEKTA